MPTLNSQCTKLPTLTPKSNFTTLKFPNSDILAFPNYMRNNFKHFTQYYWPGCYAINPYAQEVTMQLRYLTF